MITLVALNLDFCKYDQVYLKQSSIKVNKYCKYDHNVHKYKHAIDQLGN